MLVILREPVRAPPPDLQKACAPHPTLQLPCLSFPGKRGGRLLNLLPSLLKNFSGNQNHTSFFPGLERGTLCVSL